MNGRRRELSPRARAEADQLRAWLQQVREQPCTCDLCPTDQELGELLALSDEAMSYLMAWART